MEKRLQVRMNGNHVLHRIAEVAPWHPAPEMRALQIPIDPAKRDDMRPLHAPAPVAVREGSGGEPVEVELGRRWRRVARVADRWTLICGGWRSRLRVRISGLGWWGMGVGVGRMMGRLRCFGMRGRVCGIGRMEVLVNIFFPRRDAKGREELQRQHLFCPRRTRRGAKNCNVNTSFVRGGRGGARRTATSTPLLSAEDAKGREELQRQHLFCPRRTRRTSFLLSESGFAGLRWIFGMADCSF